MCYCVLYYGTQLVVNSASISGGTLQHELSIAGHILNHHFVHSSYLFQVPISSF